MNMPFDFNPITLSLDISEPFGASEKAIVINSVSDFPDPVNGIITLPFNQDYIIDGIVDIGVNKIRQETGSTNSLITIDGFSIGGGGGKLLYTGTESMFITTDGGASLGLVGLHLIASNGSLFDLGNNWSPLPNYTTSGVDNRDIFCLGHNLVENDFVRLPSGDGDADEWFYVSNVYNLASFQINKSPSNPATDKPGAFACLSSNTGGFFTAENTVFTTKNVGILNNYSLVNVSSFTLFCQDGFKFSNISRLNIDGFQWSANLNNNGIAILLYAVFDSVSISRGYFAPALTEYALLIEPQSTVRIGNVNGVSFSGHYGGGFFAPTSLDGHEPVWRFSGNSGVHDSNVIGFLSDSNNTTNETAISVKNIWYKINTNQTVLALNSGRFEMPISGRLLYTGVEELHGNAFFSLTVDITSGSGAKYLEFGIFKNGAIIPGYLSQKQVEAVVRTAVLMCPIVANTGDYFEIFVRNTTDNSDCIVHSLQFLITI